LILCVFGVCLCSRTHVAVCVFYNFFIGISDMSVTCH
jgi:hypothetical protein